MPSVLLIGKGPSAANAQSHVSAREPAACLNDAGKLLSGGEPIAFCFFTDIEQIEAAKPLAYRTLNYICPSKLHRNTELCSDDPPDWIPRECLHRYPYRTCDPRRFRQLVKRRIICHRSTATAAMSWLAYQGFDHLRLIGFDGGTAYANGVNPGLPHGFNCDVFREAQLKLADVLKEVMGVTTEWLT